jgi:hypothetical protein
LRTLDWLGGIRTKPKFAANAEGSKQTPKIVFWPGILSQTEQAVKHRVEFNLEKLNLLEENQKSQV